MLDTLFLICAIVGGVAFALRTLLMLLGIGDGFGGDADLHADAAGAHGDHDAGTQLLSIQGLAAFLMMFGLVGLALRRESDFAGPIAVAGALVAGLASMWVVAWVFRLMSRLQSSGNIDLTSAVGRQGVVYLTIRPGSSGQVQVAVQGRLGVFDAESAGGVEIATGRAVRVVAVRAGALIVEPLPAT